MVFDSIKFKVGFSTFFHLPLKCTLLKVANTGGFRGFWNRNELTTVLITIRRRKLPTESYVHFEA